MNNLTTPPTSSSTAPTLPMQIASFPQIKRLEEFDFSYQPKLNEKLR